MWIANCTNLREYQLSAGYGFYLSLAASIGATIASYYAAIAIAARLAART